jgi:hypothetical protein
MKKTIILIHVFMCLAWLAQAQFSQFHAGFVFPNGKFADGDEKRDDFFDGKGFASTGFTIGFKQYNPLSATEGLSWVWGIEAYYNGVNSDYRDAVDDTGWDDVTFPKYLNFPLTVGINYAIPINEKAKIYGEAALGGNFSLPTVFKLGDRSGYQDMEIKVTPAFGFAYGIEGGLFINNKYSIGLRYNNLGSYKYKYEIEYEDADSKKDKYDKALPITNISLSVGLLF